MWRWSGTDKSVSHSVQSIVLYLIDCTQESWFRVSFNLMRVIKSEIRYHWILAGQEWYPDVFCLWSNVRLWDELGRFHWVSYWGHSFVDETSDLMRDRVRGHGFRCCYRPVVDRCVVDYIIQVNVYILPCYSMKKWFSQRNLLARNVDRL